MSSFVGRLLGVVDRSAENGIPAGRLRRRNFQADIVPDDAADPFHAALKGDSFAPEKSYFSVKLVEMRLADAHNYIAEYVPMCSCFLRYTYGTTRRDVPFTISYETIRSALGKDAAKGSARRVEFQNIYIVRDVPVKPDGLTMYTALCRVADSSFARGMLDLLADATGAIGGAAAGTIARAGTDLTKRLTTLLGADGVTTRFGVMDGSALRQSGYRIFAGADDRGSDLVEKDLRIQDGKLVLGSGSGAGTTVDDIDYLVVALEYRDTLVEDAFGLSAHLPFHAGWGDVKSKLLLGDRKGADEALRALTLQIATSPDLIEADRLGMIATYRRQAEQWKQASKTTGLRAGNEGNITTRLIGLAEDKATPLEKPVASVLRSVSNAIVVQKPVGFDPGQLLDPEALTQAARAVRSELALSTAAADEAMLASATRYVVSAAVSAPLF